MLSNDNIDHEFLLRTIEKFPARELIRQWLKAGYMEDGVFHETASRTPQGGSISPLLANLALHGMEEALGVQYLKSGTVYGKRAVVRFADDFAVFCKSKADAEEARVVLAQWLAERGLQLAAEKTRIVHLSEGFDFLGFNIRHYKMPQTTKTGYKLLIKPSRKAVKAIRAKLSDKWRSLRGHNVAQVLRELNPIIRGWANYNRIGVASRTFVALDYWMHLRARRWSVLSHRNKPWSWRKNRYWGDLNKNRPGNNSVFGDKRTGKYLLEFAWFPIERHVLIRGAASPDDASLAEYWLNRQKAKSRNLSAAKQKLAQRQNDVCPLCGASLYNDEEIQEHHRKPRNRGGMNEQRNLVLVHLYCQQQIHSGRIIPRDAAGKLLLLN